MIRRPPRPPLFPSTTLFRSSGDLGIRIPRRGMPDAAKAAVARGNFRLKHGARGLAEQQIGMADDAGADRGGTVAAARPHRSEEHTSELQSLAYLVCRLLLEK